MINVKLKGVNIYNPIKNREKQLIDLFVSYYGEEHRQLITEKISNTTFIFTPRNVDFQGEAKEVEEHYYFMINRGYNSLLSACGTRYGSVSDSFDFNNCTKYIKALKENYCFEEDIEGLQEVAKVFNINSITEKGGFKDFKGWLGRIENKNGLLEHLNKMEYFWNLVYKDYIHLLEKERTSILQQLQPYEEELKKLNEGYDKELDKIACKFILKHKAKKVKLTNSQCLVYAKLWKSLILYNTKFTEFAFFDKQIAIYIPLFNALGFSYKNVEDYKNEQLYNLIYKSPEAKQLSQKNYFCTIQKYVENPYIKDALKKLEKLHIKGGNFVQAKCLLNFINIRSSMTAYATSYFDKHTEQQKNICVFGNSAMFDNAMLFHEVNHVIESKISNSETEDCNVITTGWDTYTVENYNKDFSLHTFLDYSKYYKYRGIQKERPNELINEIFNEYIAQEIGKIAQQQYLVFCAGESQYRCAYASSFPIIARFFEHHKDVILESRLKSDINILIDYMSEEGYVALKTFVEAFHIISSNGKMLKAIVDEIETKSGKKVNLYEYEDFIHLDYDWSKNTKSLIEIYTYVDQIDSLVTLNNKGVQKIENNNKLDKNDEENEAVK